MNKIKFNDGTRLPLHNITSTSEKLIFSVLDDVRNGLEDICKNTDALSVIQFIDVNEETQDESVLKGYAGYTKLVSITTEYEGLTSNIDYTTTDSTTKSGFVEEKHDVTTVTLQKPSQIAAMTSAITELQESQAEQDDTIAEILYGGEE